MGSLGRRLACATLVALVAGGSFASEAAAASLYAATYFAGNVPQTIGEGATATVSVTLTNSGTATWNAAGPNPVNLTYHWYAPGGAAVVWDGARTSLPGDVPPGRLFTTDAKVQAPMGAGAYELRFALVKEGVAWFDPQPVGLTVSVTGAYAATFGPVSTPRFVAGGTYTISTPVTNAGPATWTAGGPMPVNLAYHWHDAQGRTAVWDGLRTSIGADLASGQSRTLSATVRAPEASGTYALTFDMVREGAGWFGSPSRLIASVEPATFAAAYGFSAPTTFLTGETRSFPVTVTNAGNVPWNAAPPNAIAISYHWVDEAGRTAVWDGLRTPLAADVAPGASAKVDLRVVAPAQPGTYALRVDAVREGLAWFSGLGAPASAASVQVTTGYGAGYDDFGTTPPQMTMNSVFPMSLTLYNTGVRTWPAAGTNPVSLSYHWYDAAGNLVLWDGARGALEKDVPAGQQLSVTVNVTAPERPGTYTLAYDLVQDGLAWFSIVGVQTKRVTIAVTSGVTFYGKGWGHGVGLSQWGAQGWATGASGLSLTGELIVQKYYPGAQITPLPQPVKPFRVLLSTPSTACIGQTIFSRAQMRSDGGMRLVPEYAPTAPVLNAAAGQTVRIWVDGNTMYAMDEWSGRVIWSGTDPLTLLPLDPNKPIVVDQKAAAYRGNLLFQARGFNSLRVVNYVNSDDYARGSVPAEMPTGWHLEAYKAQAYAARTYAAWKQSNATANAFDLRDDTSDQCYGGATVETPITTTAALGTAGRILTYNGAPIRAYYASSHGGATDSDGCVWGLVRAGSSWTCGAGEPYLSAVQDPADALARDPRGPNPQRFWTRTFTGAQMRQLVIAASGTDIGDFVAVDLSNRAPGGHLISVRVRGTFATADLRADSFLRTTLGLKSTFVRLGPF